MKLTILIYNGLTALDAIGPYEVLWRLPGVETVFVGPDGPGPVRTDNGLLGLMADKGLEDVDSTDILLIPGGPGSGELGQRDGVRQQLLRLDASSKVTATVCTGSLILAAAGCLSGKQATTHWAFLDQLEGYGATPVAERIVRDGKYYSAAGVSAGIDMALQLAADLASESVAKAIQLGIEYEPEPPFNHGRPENAEPEILEGVRRRLREGRIDPAKS